jgi:hypothetical protein
VRGGVGPEIDNTSSLDQVSVLPRAMSDRTVDNARLRTAERGATTTVTVVADRDSRPI